MDFLAVIAVIVAARLLWWGLTVRYAMELSMTMPVLVWRTFDEVVALGCPRIFAPKVLALLADRKVLEWRYAAHAPDSIRSRSPLEWKVMPAEAQYYEYRRTSKFPPKPRDLIWKNKWQDEDEVVPEPI